MALSANICMLGCGMMLDEGTLLGVARAWKAGELTKVHPEVGRLLNATLVRNGEQVVPHARSTSLDAPTVAELICAEHARAPGRLNGHVTPARTRTWREASARVQGGA